MALTVGVATVLDAREVVVVVTGQRKSLALSKAIEEGVNHLVSAQAAENLSHHLMLSLVDPFCFTNASLGPDSSRRRRHRRW